jgi:hypothetical protein
MTARSNFLLALLCGLACLSGVAEATTLQAPAKFFGPEDEVRLASSERVQLEMTACFEWAAERRELAVTYRVSEDQSLLAFVHCHGRRDSEGQIPVEVIRCKKEVALAWQCEHHYTYYRIDFGKNYVLAVDGEMIIEVPGESPDRSSEAMAAILASEPGRLHGKYCELPRYRDGTFEIECEGVQYAVKRTCDQKGCRRAVRRK